LRNDVRPRCGWKLCLSYGRKQQRNNSADTKLGEWWPVKPMPKHTYTSKDM
jgi:hypothetical protein